MFDGYCYLRCSVAVFQLSGLSPFPLKALLCLSASLNNTQQDNKKQSTLHKDKMHCCRTTSQMRVNRQIHATTKSRNQNRCSNQQTSKQMDIVNPLLNSTARILLIHVCISSYNTVRTNADRHLFGGTISTWQPDEAPVSAYNHHNIKSYIKLTNFREKRLSVSKLGLSLWRCTAN